MKKVVFIVIIISLLFISCESGENEVNNNSLTANSEGKVSDLKDVTLTQNEDILISDFGIDMLKRLFDNKNIMISPVSILSAMGMTENGAVGNTLSEMEQVFKMDLSIHNKYFKNYNENKSKELSIANSIWIKDDPNLIVEEDFIARNKEYYNSEIYKENFSNETLKNINNWVSKKTDKMIDKILKEINPEAVMYLINAICFKADWEREYTEQNVFDSEFTLENGEKENIKMMHSEESIYLEDENTKGLMKYYKDRRYAFIGLLPNENITMKEYLNTLDGKKIKNLIENKYEESVVVNLPKFKSEYDIELKKVLIDMGIKDAFNSARADFSNLGSTPDGNICINKVIHKTFIEVDEKGTKAAAVTAVEMTKESAVFEEKQISFNRPFVYMIYDVKHSLPIFIGVEMNINDK